MNFRNKDLYIEYPDIIYHHEYITYNIFNKLDKLKIQNNIEPY